MKNISRIYASIFKWAPISATLTIMYNIVGAIYPAAISVISIGLFDNAVRAFAGESTEIYFYIFLYLIICAVKEMFSYFDSITMNAGIYEKGTAYFRIALYEKLARLPLISFENAEMMNQKARAERAVDDETLSSFFNRSLICSRSVVAIIGVAVVLSRYSLWLLPLSVLSVLPYLLARLIRGKSFTSLKRAQAKKTRLQTYLWSLFTTKQSIKEMRVMGSDKYITDKWRDTRDEANEELWTLQKKDALSLLLCDGFRIIGYCASIIVVLLLVVRGDITIGVFGGAITAFLGLQSDMRTFLSDLGRFPEQLAYAADYYTFMDMPEESNGVMTYSGLQKSITLDAISFKYPNSEIHALNPLNLVISKGEKIAILGENGSGKTTLTKILLGLYPPESGEVRYDGKAVQSIAKESLYTGVSAVAQDFISYSLTLRENVAISDLSRLYSDSEILNALALAGVDHDLSLDDAMGREFGGKELSGGQWQKIAIARGMFKNSELIVLDEPTSALDPLIETEILTNFIKVAEGKTALIVSHRVGLCKLVDRIIVLKNGDIVEDGKRDVLLAAGGEYARLYEAQAQWYQ